MHCHTVALASGWITELYFSLNRDCLQSFPLYTIAPLTNPKYAVGTAIARSPHKGVPWKPIPPAWTHGLLTLHLQRYPLA